MRIHSVNIALAFVVVPAWVIEEICLGVHHQQSSYHLGELDHLAQHSPSSLSSSTLDSSRSQTHCTVLQRLQTIQQVLSYFVVLHLHHLHLALNCKGHWGTTDDFTACFLVLECRKLTEAVVSECTIWYQACPCVTPLSVV